MAPSRKSAAWFILHRDTILDSLRRAASGEDPDLLLLEVVANSDVEDVHGE